MSCGRYSGKQPIIHFYIQQNGGNSLTQQFSIVDLNYISLYYAEFDDAVDFYTAVFGPPGSAYDSEGSQMRGWKMGATWLTLFNSKESPFPGENPRNTEFAIQVSAPDEVDALYHALVKAGAVPGWEPRDTEMYVPMRFAYVEDPFGVRIDVICPSQREA